MPREQIEDWIHNYIANILGLASDSISRSAPFDQVGLDSLTGIALVGDLEELIGIDLNPAIAYDHPSIAALATHVAALSEVNSQRLQVAGVVS